MTPRRFSYLTLWYQPDLGRQASAPFAVIVEVRSHDGPWEVFCFGKYLDADESSVAGQILARFPEVLRERVSNAMRRAVDGERAVDLLRGEFNWNIHAQGPDALDSTDSIKRVSYNLFLEHVENETETLAQFRRENVDDQPEIERSYQFAASSSTAN